MTGSIDTKGTRRPQRKALWLVTLGLIGIVGGVMLWSVLGDRAPHVLAMCGPVDESKPSINGCWVLPFAQFRGTIWPTREHPRLRAVVWWSGGEEDHALPIPQAAAAAFETGDNHEVFPSASATGLLWLEYEYRGRRIRLPRWGGPYVFSTFATPTLLMFMTTPSEVDSRRAIVGYVFWQN